MTFYPPGCAGPRHQLDLCLFRTLRRREVQVCCPDSDGNEREDPELHQGKGPRICGSSLTKQDPKTSSQATLPRPKCMAQDLLSLHPPSRCALPSRVLVGQNGLTLGGVVALGAVNGTLTEDLRRETWDRPHRTDLVAGVQGLRGR